MKKIRRGFSRPKLIFLTLTLVSLITVMTIALLNRYTSRPVDSIPTETTHYTTWYGRELPIDTTIQPSSGDYAFKNDQNTFRSYFKVDPFTHQAIRFTYQGSSLSFFTPVEQGFGTLTPVEPKIELNQLIYPSVSPQLDLVYTIEPTRLLEEFIVHDATTAAQITQITQQAVSENISGYQQFNGSIFFTKKSLLGRDRTAFTLPRPVIYEVGDKSKESFGITYQIEQTGKQTYTISKVITDEGKAWLADPSRVYPVAIDLVIDNADTAGNWISSDPTNTTVTQETTIKQEGTGSVKVQTTATNDLNVDLLEYSSEGNAQSAYVSNASSFAPEGTITYFGGYTIHTFTTNGTFTPVITPLTVEALVVGGGGGGGGSQGTGVGGGGGGGGVVYNAAYAVTGNIAVTIGAAGARGQCGSVGDGCPYSSGTAGGNGGSSVFGTITAVGGGGGGKSGGEAGQNGANGGGGATMLAGGGSSTGGGYSGGQGSDCSTPCRAGGGGGAGGAGVAGLTSGNGGIGYNSSISGSSAYYGGGGAGNSYSGSHGTPGLGGGAVGYVCSVNGSTGCKNGESATANTGGGGAGASISERGWGGLGGSGIVIARYPTGLRSYSEATIKTQGSYALKGVASQTTSLNKTLTRTIASPLNLSDKTGVTFDIRASRTGSNIKVGLHDSGGTTTELTPNITQADTFQSVTIDLSGVANANKDAIDQIIITIVNADAANTFYLDNMVANAPSSLDDTITRTTSPTDLSANTGLSFWVRSSVAGSYARFEIGESASTEQTYSFTINAPNTWEQKTMDLTGITGTARDAITKYAIRFTSNTTGATFYFDEIKTITTPAAPTIQTATALTASSIRWNFTDNSTSETGFKVYDSALTTTNMDLMEYANNSTAQTAYPSNAPNGTGGTISTSGNDTIHTFTSNGTFTPSDSGNVEYLVVAGGGGGGSNRGGGGGAGGFRTGTLAVAAQAYTVTVGAGGAGGNASPGSDGGNSVFSTITSIGGGGGGGEPGRSGGSGGGGRGAGSGNLAGGSGTLEQGTAGGNGTTSAMYGGGGGGGAGASGGNAYAGSGGAGGNGIASSISGASVTYAGGGGGGVDGAPDTGGAGGTGGGGAGSNYWFGNPATANTGSGGGGGHANYGGGNGGSGIVIVRYPAPLLAFTENSLKTEGSYALKAVAAATSSLDKTLTKTIGSPINLSDKSSLTFDIRSTRTGRNIKVGIRDAGGITTEITPNITSANAYQAVTWDISGVANANKDAIDQIIITIVNADASNTFYLDNFVSSTSVLKSTCASANLSSCDETSLSPNTQYTRKVTAYNSDSESAYSGTTSLYTLAEVPVAPTVTNRAATTVSVNPGAGSNPAATTYAIYRETNTATCDGSGGVYLAANGSSNGATAVWQTEAAWATVTATGLDANSAYVFCVKAKNGDNVETAWSQLGAHNASYVPLGGDFVCTNDTVNTSTFTNRYVDGNNPSRYVIGVDSGSGNTNTAIFKVQSCLMTINATDTLVVGKLELGSGSIAIAQGGEIKIGQPLWAVDADADGYTTDNKLYFGSAPTNGRRKNLLTSLSTQDCSDSAYSTSNTCYISATGGTVFTDGNYKIHAFTGNGNFIVTGSGTVEVLVVGGGGGGGGGQGGTASSGGGGGGGAVVYNAAYAVNNNTVNVTVGAGGSKGTCPDLNYDGCTTSVLSNGGNGGSSTFGTITAAGGGGGGHKNSGAGQNGGNGGGGGIGGAAGTGTQGYNGGAGGTDPNGGGGGGAGGAGVSGAVTGGSGGNSYVTAMLNGHNTFYGGGGGGGSYYGGYLNNGSLGTSGASGGSNEHGHGFDGIKYTGGGGGGAISGFGGLGGTGVVLVKYQYRDCSSNCFMTATGGTVTTSGNYKIHTFTGSDTFTVTSNPSTAEVLVVAGGGGGGSGVGTGGSGGGGGGGGVVYHPGYQLAQQGYSVVIGAGGAGGAAQRNPGSPGSNSSFNDIVALGGGAGNGETEGTKNGGSGGGGTGDVYPGTPHTPGTSTQTSSLGWVGFGNTGGFGKDGGGGGGGGAGQHGHRNRGGDGIYSLISGSGLYYGGGGGGGGVTYTPNGGAGGLGGGGTGATGTGNATHGTANTGGGGGGAREGTRGNGGSGVVIVRYRFQ